MNKPMNPTNIASFFYVHCCNTADPDAEHKTNALIDAQLNYYFDATSSEYSWTNVNGNLFRDLELRYRIRDMIERNRN